MISPLPSRLMTKRVFSAFAFGSRESTTSGLSSTPEFARGRSSAASSFFDMSSVSMKNVTRLNTMSIIGVMFSLPSSVAGILRGIGYLQVRARRGDGAGRAERGLLAEALDHVLGDPAEVDRDLGDLVAEVLVRGDRGHRDDEAVERRDERSRDAGREVGRRDRGAERLDG